MLLDDIENKIFILAKNYHDLEMEACENDYPDISPDIYYEKAIKAIEEFGGSNVRFMSCEWNRDLEDDISEYVHNSNKPVYIINDPYHKFAGWSVSGCICFEHPKVPKHPQLEGMDKLVEDLGNLRYDSLAEFLNKLSKKLESDGHADEARGRMQLSKQLAYAAKSIGNAWKICKPYFSKDLPVRKVGL